MALSVASCNKNTAASADEAGEARELVSAIDKASSKASGKASGKTAGKASDKASGDSTTSPGAKATPPAEATPVTPPGPPVNVEPIPGVELGKLDDAKKQRFYRLVDRLQSPCGKAHSLRKSLTSDASCKRSQFAAKYVIAMMLDEATDKDVQMLYEDHYRAAEKKSFKLDGIPHSGSADAPVKLVEFYDYGCPACKEFAPVLEEALSAFPKEAVLFYKQFPLPSHPDSKPAAQAALAAGKQGKFVEMHKILFAKPHRHKKSDVLAHAKSLGLDMKKFEADFASAAPRVLADVAEGDAAGIHGTPTLFINGRQYAGPMHPRYVKMWIEEELAVNR